MNSMPSDVQINVVFAQADFQRWKQDGHIQVHVQDVHFDVGRYQPFHSSNIQSVIANIPSKI